MIIQYGGQTPLKLANDLERFNVPIFGTSPDQIDLSEDRARFLEFVENNNLTQPPNGMASNKEEAIDILGGTRCGKVPFKERTSLTPEQLAEQRTIRCYRLLYGIISFKGKKANGEIMK